MKRRFQAVTTDEPSVMVLLRSVDDARHDIDPKFNPCNFTIDIPNAQFITEVTKVIPLYFQCDNKFDFIEKQKDVSDIFVSLNGLIGGNMLTSKGGQGLLYEIICATHRTKSLTPEATQALPPVLYENSGDIYLWDVDYATPRDMSRINIQLLDGDMNLLMLPSDVKVTLLLKVFHATHHR